MTKRPRRNHFLVLTVEARLLLDDLAGLEGWVHVGVYHDHVGVYHDYVE